MTVRILLVAVLLAFGTVAAADKPPAPAKSGLSLPAAREIDYKPGKLVRIEAAGANDVAWEVVASPAVELDFEARGASLLLGMPPPGTTVTVVAAAVVDGKPRTARTAVTVKGELLKAQAAPPKVGKVRFLTFAGDGYELARANTLLRAAADRGVRVTAVSWEDAKRAKLGFDELDVPAKDGVMVFQAADGEVIPRGVTHPIPLGNEDPVAAVLHVLDTLNSLGK